jgi:hypothetical protein
MNEHNVLGANIRITEETGALGLCGDSRKEEKKGGKGDEE